VDQETVPQNRSRRIESSVCNFKMRGEGRERSKKKRLPHVKFLPNNITGQISQREDGDPGCL